MAREELESAAKDWLTKHRRAIDDGPGIPPQLVSDLADFAEAHAAQVGVIAVKRADNVPDGEMTEAEAALLAREMARTTAAAADLVLHPGAPPAPTDAQIAAWIERNPKAFADWAAKQARTAVPAKPAPRRRTTR
jgi:hypothetical protein